MDDRHTSDINVNNGKNLCKEAKTYKCSLLENFLSSKTRTNDTKRQSSSKDITCLSIFKKIFHQRSKSNTANADHRTSILTY
jgi:hypothetical protein